MKPVPAPASPIVSSRRAFCLRTCQALSLSGAGVLLHACGGGSSPTAPSTPVPALPVVAGSLANGMVAVSVGSGTPLASAGGAALVQSPAGTFLVTRTGQSTFVALTATCTHEACTITGRQDDTFVCPCHGSRFSPAGAVLNGPATRALPQFATTLSGDVLSIAV